MYLDIQYIILVAVAVIIVVFNRIGKKFQLIEITSSAIIVSRLFMAEMPVYFDDIQSITLKEKQNGNAMVVFCVKGKKMNFFEIDYEVYEKLVNAAIKNNLNFYIEDSKGIKEKLG